MKRIIASLLFSLTLMFNIESVFAGPFGIEMGMSLEQVKSVCKTTPKKVIEDAYEITPPKTNNMFETYVVRIDPDYGVYWLKAIGKDLHSNNYGDRLKTSFESLVESIRKTYGEEMYRIDEVKEGSIWNDPGDFMYALQQGDRELYAVWEEFNENSVVFILNSLLKDPEYNDRVVEYMAAGDTIAVQTLLLEKSLQISQLPDDIASIYVEEKAKSTTKGYMVLEYNFSNKDDVKDKEDSVF